MLYVDALTVWELFIHGKHGVIILIIDDSLFSGKN